MVKSGWNSSSIFQISFSILPLCGLQLPLCEKQSFSTLGKGQNAFDNTCLWKISILQFRFTVVMVAIKSRRLPGDQCSLWGAQLRRTTRPFALWNLILAHLQHSEFDIVYTSHSLFETFHWSCVYCLHQLCPTQMAYWAKNYLIILTRAAHCDLSKLNLAYL